MAHAFADGSVGLWVVNPANLADRLPKIAAFADGMFSDVFAPTESSPSDMALIRATPRPNGTKLRAQLWTTPRGRPAATFATSTLGDIQRLKPGVVELDIEVPDAVLTDYITDTVNAIRVVRPRYLLRVDIAPYKGRFLPAALFQSDAALFASEQTYYGDMSRVSEGEALLDLIQHGMPLAKASLCYGAAGPPWFPASAGAARVNTLGTLYYQGSLVRKLQRGLVFQDDLMADMGLL